MTQTKITSPATKGLVIGLVLIVISLAITITGQEENRWLSYGSYLIFIIGIAWAISTYARQINYNTTFGGYFRHGFSTTAIVTCLMIIFTVVLLLVDPSVKEKALEVASKNMSKQGLTEDQMKQGLEMTKKFFLPFALLGIVVGYVVMGVIVSLVTAAVMKKDPRPIIDEEEDLLNIAN